MKIKTKLIVGFAVILLILASVTAFGYVRLTRMDDSMSSFYDNRFQKVQIVVNARGEVNAANAVITGIIMGTTEPKSGVSEITNRLTAAAKQFALLSDSHATAVEKQIIEQIKNNAKGYGEFLNSFMRLAQEGKVEEGKQLYVSKGIPSTVLVINSLNGLIVYEQQTLEEEMANTKAMYKDTVRMVAALTVLGILLGLAVLLWVLPQITKGLNQLGRMADRFSKGRLKGFARMNIRAKDELGDLARVFRHIAMDLLAKNEKENEYNAILQRQARKDAQMARVTELLRQTSDTDAVAQSFIDEFAPVVGAAYGAVYLVDPASRGKMLQLAGSYAGSGDAVGTTATVRRGEGLVGQCAATGNAIVLDEVPQGYVRISSGLGSSEPRQLALQPVKFDEEIIGVIELAGTEAFRQDDLELLADLAVQFGTLVQNIRSRQRVEELLRESQAQSEELQAQSEELISQSETLRQTNDELEAQRNELKRSEARLQQQQEELEHANQELTVKTQALEEHIDRTETQNRQIAKANADLERQALQLAMTGKYRSEFLANMSHELRTPLNSLLILSEFLAENKEGNLNEKQKEYMKTIHLSGTDLLKMIDEILDLSKVDAGKMEIHPEWTVIGDIATYFEHQYTPMALQKGLTLSVDSEEGIPQAIWTDGHRLKQILRNLFSNAIKFTHAGSVSLAIVKPTEEDLASLPKRTDGDYVAFRISDTGIGISPEKSEVIFEAFRQADGTTSRKYGGTGLGLTISRELAKLLGGWIRLETEAGRGSTFTLILPERAPASEAANAEAPHTDVYPEVAAAGVLPGESDASLSPVAEHGNEPVPDDDRDSLAEGDRVLLIVEDDIHFAKVLLEMARTRGFKGVIALRGDEGLERARTLKPDAILLDIQLPVTDGWSILHQLKLDKETRHIPVQVISVTEQSSHGLRMGALDHLKKPATAQQLEEVFTNISTVLDRKPKRLLLVEPNQEDVQNLTELIGHDDVLVEAVSSAEGAWEQLQNHAYDCLVLSSGLDDGSGIALMEKIQRSPNLHRMPVILHGGEESQEEALWEFRKFADKIVMKDVKSPERLLEETALFLHRVEAELPEEKRRMLRKLHRREAPFENKKVLLVDDDVRNVFALSSVLEHRKMEVVYAENGKDALEKLEEHPDVDIILMDIMMPEMDGYEAMTRIRENAAWKSIPIIALTAKAMRDDRSKCIEAGASDYITKPVHTEQLLSLMRVWLYR
ncbi:response regulator [Cohnella candidum]|uniref:Circadian input-output histidine kinase CikA n=1 Tax=Cohnella candidum TaxID=2674991 RepID=A0A3G3JSQ1_9BACL|nr:response regulator [Cohnella candidum]AYQ71243.1 response regulator [Cohnella candidum]